MLGDRQSEANPFRWDTVACNLPGTWEYDPTMPKLFKQRVDGSIAGGLEPPEFVPAAARLADDLAMLLKLTEDEVTPRVTMRARETAVGYLFGDASGGGFGTSLWTKGSGMVDLTYGTRRSEMSKESSNFREFANFVRRVEQLMRDGKLKPGTELFMFTDNFVTECIWHKGIAKSRLLHGLVQRLRKLEMTGQLIIHMVWVASTRMIKQGTDGLSRGDLFTGVMSGREFLEFVPISKGVLEQSPELEEWIREHFPRKESWNILSKEGWFDKGFKDGNHIWAPPPVIADAVLDNLCESVLVRPWSPHILVCPALMASSWRK
jgi:hypothetical protein